ncbi:MAG: tRNA modification GTPase [Planctomycetaceae bacterium]
MNASLPCLDDTIAALASASGSAARGIVRVSGCDAFAIAELMLCPTDGAQFDLGRRAGCVTRSLRVVGFSRPVPAELGAWPGGRSYTRQPLVELHLPGSAPILDAVLGDMYRHGARAAQPGEFTLRAFLSGRIDLIQAEAVLGVIDAGDRRDLHVALEQLAGGVSNRILRLRGDLLDLLADLEAGLDFADEAIEFVSHAVLAGRVGMARDELVEMLRQAAGRSRGTTRPTVVLAGPSNAGKSTLFNALVEADAALVSPVSGTTRDYLTCEIELDGLPVTLIDTAGAELAASGVREAAQQKRGDGGATAALVVWCEPADGAPRESLPCADDRLLLATTKADLVANPTGPLCVSAQTGQGLGALRAAVAARRAGQSRGDAPLLATTAVRCREGLAAAAVALDRALAIAREEADDELLAIEIRDSLQELGKIVGAVYTDDLLDRIFSKFCIGK